jgi:spore coat polysaccharide biosynthesis protein SpsF
VKKITAIIQARLGSTRLSGKVLYPALKKPFLCHLLERIQRSKKINEFLIVTTDHSIDKTLGEYAKQYNCKIFYGESEYVLDNIIKACDKYNIETIVDITADCPLIDHREIDKMIKIYNYYQKNNMEITYVANVVNRTWPRGFDLQIYDAKTLRYYYKKITNEKHKNHSGWNILIREQDLKIFDYYYNGNLSEWRLCIDEYDDYVLIKKIFEYFKDNKFSAYDIINYLKKNPKLLEINKNVKQKKAGQG